MTPTNSPPAQKPKFACDVECPACGALVGVQCSRRPAGMSYKVRSSSYCYARTAKLRRALGLKGAATRPIVWRNSERG